MRTWPPTTFLFVSSSSFPCNPGNFFHNQIAADNFTQDCHMAMCVISYASTFVFSLLEHENDITRQKRHFSACLQRMSFKSLNDRKIFFIIP